MHGILQKYVTGFRKQRRKKRQVLVALFVLSCLVASGVFWQLRLVGVALNDEASCGKIEHQHTEDCIQRVLICDKEEGAPDGDPVLVCTQQEHQHSESCYAEQQTLVCTETHEHTEVCYQTEPVLVCTVPEHTHTDACWEQPIHQHTDACYETQYLCGQEEHVHTLQCYADLHADRETAAEWEATLPEITGVWADDLLAVAQSQLGYTESSRNYVLAEDGETMQGYTRYGACYGNPYGDWNAMFAAFCLQYAQIPDQVIPQNSGAFAMAAEADRWGLYADAAYIPQPGDVVFLRGESSSDVARVGIVSAVEEAALLVIQGDVEHTVAEVRCDKAEAVGYIDRAKAEARAKDLHLLPEPPVADPTVTTEQALAEKLAAFAEKGDALNRFLDDWVESDPLPEEAQQYKFEMDGLYEQALALYQQVDPTRTEEAFQQELAAQYATAWTAYLQAGGRPEKPVEPIVPAPVPGKLEQPLQYDSEEVAVQIALEGEILFPGAAPTTTDVPAAEEQLMTLEEPIVEAAMPAAADPWKKIQGQVAPVGDETDAYEDFVNAVMGQTPEEILTAFTAFDVTFLYENQPLPMDGCTLTIQITPKDKFLQGSEAMLLAETATSDQAAGEEPQPTQERVLAVWQKQPDGTVTLLQQVPLNPETAQLPTITAAAQPGSTLALSAQTLTKKKPGPMPDTIIGVDTDRKGVKIHLFDYTEPDVNRGHTLEFNQGGVKDGTSMNDWTGKNQLPQFGMVANRLQDGFPVLQREQESLAYLFDPNTRAKGVTPYPNRNRLFQWDPQTGRYWYDGERNFATIRKRKQPYQQDFILYAEPSRYWNADSAVKWVRFLPFDPFAPGARDKDSGEYLYPMDNSKANYHFGMSIEIPFLMPPNGQITLPNGNDADMTFHFRGDDDVWVFLDDQLVMDMGGLHDSADGTINFSTGDVQVNVTAAPATSKAQPNMWQEVFRQKFSDYSMHTLKFFYMERGKYASNCAIDFNLPVEPTGALWLEKERKGPEAAGNPNETFAFQVTLKPHKGQSAQPLENVKYTIYQTYQDYDAGKDVQIVAKDQDLLLDQNQRGTISLQHGQFAVLENLPYGTQYTVMENGAAEYATTLKTGVCHEKHGQTTWEESVHAKETSGTIQSGATTRIHFTNTKDYELPSTGGLGIHIFLATGSLCMLGAVWGLYRKGRRKEGRPF